VTLEQVHGEAPRVLKSHVEIGESSRAKPRVTTRILLNKWQRQLEKERYQKRKYEEERRRAEEEARRRDLEQYTREQYTMTYTTFRKLGMGPGDLTPTSIILNDFAGNPSDTKGCAHVDLMIGSKTLLTTFFVIEGKGAYSLLLGRDWIHANCCVPSTMHQQLIQWVDDDIEVVQADNSVSVANVEPAFWEYQGIDCFSGKDWGEGPVEPVSSDQQPIQVVGSYSNF
jgi:hypothetical protein